MAFLPLSNEGRAFIHRLSRCHFLDLRTTAYLFLASNDPRLHSCCPLFPIHTVCSSCSYLALEVDYADDYSTLVFFYHHLFSQELHLYIHLSEWQLLRNRHQRHLTVTPCFKLVVSCVPACSLCPFLADLCPEPCFLFIHHPLPFSQLRPLFSALMVQLICLHPCVYSAAPCCCEPSSSVS